MRHVLALVFCCGLVNGLEVTGETTDAEPGDVDEEAIDFALQAINHMFVAQGDTRPRGLVDIVSMQMVSGQKFSLTLHVTGGEEDEYCDIEVVFAPWYEQNDLEGERFEVTAGPYCATAEPTEPTPMCIPGGECPVDEVKGEILVGLMFAVREINRRSNSPNMFKMSVSHGEVEVTQQAVAGYMYRYKNVPLTETECLKEDGPYFMLEPCQERDGGQKVTCNMKVWWQSWRTPEYTMEDLYCTITQPPQRRNDADEEDLKRDEDEREHENDEDTL